MKLFDGLCSSPLKVFATDCKQQSEERLAMAVLLFLVFRFRNLSV